MFTLMLTPEERVVLAATLSIMIEQAAFKSISMRDVLQQIYTRLHARALEEDHNG